MSIIIDWKTYYTLEESISLWNNEIEIRAKKLLFEARKNRISKENNFLSDSFILFRDIPYKIPNSISDIDCCCNWKHRLYKDFLEKKWLYVRYRVCSFLWSDLNIPWDILKLTDDFSTHVYLEVFINWKWIDVDLTWDSLILKKFKINNWDWENNTQIAVTPKEIYSIEKSQEIMKNIDYIELDNYFSKNKLFITYLNNWIDTLRNN